MRKPKPKNANPIHTHGDRIDIASLPVVPMIIHNESLSSFTKMPIPIPVQSESELNIKEKYDVLLQKVIEQVMCDIISDVITKIETTNELRN
jgi:hypothetical protein